MTDFTILRRRILEEEYQNLNNIQKQAVFATKNPLLILAGAGSGKTTVIVNKIGYLIKYGNSYEEADTECTADDLAYLEMCLKDKAKRDEQRYLSLMQVTPIPTKNILAITFTNKAAGEMRERISNNFSITTKDLWALTFHALSVRILRSYINLLGFDNSFTIYDENDSVKLIERICKENTLEEKYVPRLVKKIISKAKTRYENPEEFKQKFSDSDYPKLPMIYEKYQDSLKKANALDFDDLIFFTVKVLSDFPKVKTQINARFKYVLVDEYQDTNPLQYKLISLLVTKGKVCVVGDDDQSIYKFMGASISNILSFETSFENAEVIRLEQNYRSTQIILDAANKVISNNENRKGKTLWTDNGDGKKIKYYCLSSQHEEADYISGQILRKSTTQGLKFSDFCVLYRTHSQSNAIELALKGNGIPYRVFGGLAFFKRKEIQDILAYFNVIRNPNDKTRLLRIINEPKRGIGDTTLEKITEIASRDDTLFFDIIKNAAKYPELQRSHDKLLRFATLIGDLQDKAGELKISELYEYMLERTGYSQMISSYERREMQQRKENMGELMNSITNFEKTADEPTLANFLEETALVSAVDNLDENDDAVVLMTMHCAKGLEFETVFISGFEEGLFPSTMSVNEPEGIEEERRLCYVAITRAKKNLYILSTRSRMTYGTVHPAFVSRFLQEIPEELIEIVKRPLPEKRRGDSRQNLHKVGSILQNFTTTQKPESKSIYTEGMKVSHQAFGQGVIKKVTQMSTDAMLEVKFEKVGVKKLMANYAKLEVI